MSELTYERAKQLYTPYDEGQMRHLCALRDVEIDRLRAENAKLRELVRDMSKLLVVADWPSIEYDEQASECIRRAEELGVEVDG